MDSGITTKTTPRLMLTAMCCAGAVTAQIVSGKATRDALFLASLDFTSLPAMLVATSVCSILLVAVNARGSRRVAPGALVPALFVASGVIFLAEWLLTFTAPAPAAVLVYLHISGAGPLLASGFWLIASERFDPRTAKKRFGQIAGAGTIGGLLSALLAERVAGWFGVAAMLPVLATLQFVSALLVRRLSLGSASMTRPPAPDDAATSPAPASGLRAVAETPYLRHLAALVLMGTTGAAMVDYLFKAEAVAAFGRGDHLLRFFAIYYAITSVITFAIQAAASRPVLDRFGLAITTSTPSITLLAGSAVALVAPGFGSLIATRAGEAIVRGSLFRAGYELFYTPIPARQKRAAKSIIDVAFDRLGDGLAGGLVRAAVMLAPGAQSPLILLVGIVCSVGAIAAASRLNRGYISSLEISLMNRGAGLDLPLRDDNGTRDLMRSALRKNRLFAAAQHGAAASRADSPAVVRAAAPDPGIQDITRLRSRDREQVVSVLVREEGLTAILVPHVIPLLAWDPVAEHAVFALRKVAEERVGELVDALLDPNQGFAVRRRLARVFSVCVSQRAADGLLFGLEDPRFDVRYQSARSLSALIEKNPLVCVHRERIEAAVLREVAVGRPVWESRRLLDGPALASDAPSPVDDFVRGRAGESLAHVFTLLSLMLPREPLQMAFRSLQSDDEYLRGTALEYLESVLPAAIRLGLWPFLETGPDTRPTRPRDEIIAELLRSNVSIVMNLEELKRRSESSLVETSA